MTRSTQRLARLVSAAVAVAALTATAAWAGDRYGPADSGAGEYSGYGYQQGADYDRADSSYDDGRWDAQSSRSRSDYERRDSRTRVYTDAQAGDVEQVDPCAVQYRLTGRRCLGDGAAPYRGARIDEERFSERGGDLEQVDPCATQYRMTGRRCASGEEFYRGARVSREDSGWRSERINGDERAAGYDRIDDADGYVEACVVAHERIGERCPYAQGRRDQDRVVWVEERLPDSFFISEGGVGPGIVDYGGGGGGGGGFEFADSFAGANASASASASAQASVSLAIAVHNHNMMHYPHKMTHGGGCGCKKGY